MPEGRPTLRERQNDPALLALLRAMSVSHARVRRLNALRMAAAMAMAALGLLASFTGSLPWVSVLGALWALAYSAGASFWADGELRRAALLQEMFDVRLFLIPWNRVIAGDEVPAHEVSRLNRRFRGDDGPLRDYYEIPDLPRPFDVLGCQHQNLGWGARVRRRYATTVAGATAGWAAMGLLVGVAADLGLTELVLRWYLPSLGVLLLGIDTQRGQRMIADERERVLRLVHEHLARTTGRAGPARTRDLLTLARQVQDAVYRTRVAQSRVPNWFFSRFRARDRQDFQESMRELAAALPGA
ncbi:S-4TM family putative pore-forming effector [Actinomadura terrae]|uniref:S-4TM family putative pore-forming effector n=1 Tax=Actinomadura terrae TaxID=604353 RepID=UPI001FA71CB6|nr:S-4TM family putative pore-forming effector [Actinomadura terrae]